MELGWSTNILGFEILWLDLGFEVQGLEDQGQPNSYSKPRHMTKRKKSLMPMVRQKVIRDVPGTILRGLGLQG